MKRAERHQLKQDEFLSGIEQAAQWFGRNRRKLLIATVVALAIGVGGGGFYLYRDRQNREADRLLSEALNFYYGHVGLQNPGETPAADAHPRFDTSDERYLKALESFEEVVALYPGGRQGRRARFYAALCQISLGRPDEAEKSLQEVVDGPRDFLYYLASSSLAVAERREGKYGPAIERYLTLLEDPENPLPKDHLLLELGQAREEAGRSEEARRDYQRLLEEYPDSPLRNKAELRRELLEHRLAGSPS